MKLTISSFAFESALERFRQQNDGGQLNALYDTIPSGHCDSCGACCYDNVPLSAAEFLALVDHLEKQGDGALEKAIEGVASWYRYQFKRAQPCVFLDQNKCTVYPVRPLVCRLFGHQSAEEQARRVPIVLEQNAQLAKALKESYNITVAKAVVDHVIRQCDFKPDGIFDKASQDSLFDQVQMVDTPYYQEGHLALDYINLSLVEWFVLAYLEEDELLDLVLSEKDEKTEI